MQQSGLNPFQHNRLMNLAKELDILAADLTAPVTEAERARLRGLAGGQRPPRGFTGKERIKTAPVSKYATLEEYGVSQQPLSPVIEPPAEQPSTDSYDSTIPISSSSESTTSEEYGVSQQPLSPVIEPPAEQPSTDSYDSTIPISSSESTTSEEYGVSQQPLSQVDAALIVTSSIDADMSITSIEADNAFLLDATIEGSSVPHSVLSSLSFESSDALISSESVSPSMSPSPVSFTLETCQKILEELVQSELVNHDGVTVAIVKHSMRDETNYEESPISQGVGTPSSHSGGSLLESISPLFRLMVGRLWFKPLLEAESDDEGEEAFQNKEDSRSTLADSTEKKGYRHQFLYPNFVHPESGGAGITVSGLLKLMGQWATILGIDASAFITSGNEFLQAISAEDRHFVVKPFSGTRWRHQNLQAMMEEFGGMVPLKQMNVRVFYEPGHTGLEDLPALRLEPGVIIANRYRVRALLGQATFSRAVHCIDLQAQSQETRIMDRIARHGSAIAGRGTRPHKDHTMSSNVCLKVINNDKEFFDQTLDEIRTLQLLKQRAREAYEQAEEIVSRKQMSTDPFDQESRQTRGDAQNDPTVIDRDESISLSEAKWLLAQGKSGLDAFRILDFREAFYFREHMVLVCELLTSNLYDFSCYITREKLPTYFTLGRIRRIGQQIAHALSFVHAQGLIHSDLKPENILFASRTLCNIKVIDFGSSFYRTDRLSSYVQSRSYRAPEVLFGSPYDDRIDVWSLGCILIEQFTGTVLFHSHSVPEMLARIVATCGPLSPTILSDSAHADKILTRDGVIFGSAMKSENIRFETIRRLKDYPYARLAITLDQPECVDSSAQNLTHKALLSQNGALCLFFPQQKYMDLPEDAGRCRPLGEPMDSRIWMHAADSRESLLAYIQELPKCYASQRRLEWMLEQSGLQLRSAVEFLEAEQESLLSSKDSALILLEMVDEHVAPLMFLDFIQQCLCMEPMRRATSTALLAHPFLHRTLVDNVEPYNPSL